LSAQDKAKAAAEKVKGQSFFAKAFEFAAVAAAVAWLVWGPLSGDGTGGGAARSLGDAPAEFLYLDGAKVLAYLAQFNGGTFTSKQITNKASDSASGKVSIQNAIELGEATQREESVSAQITPTAAGNYIELLSELETDPDGLKTIGLGRFEHDVSVLREGQLVTFRSHALRSPVYLNPYLAVRQRVTLATLFPMPAKGEGDRERVRAQRRAARRFRKHVGMDPRVVFALRPPNERELAAAAAARAEPWSSARGQRTEKETKGERKARKRREEARRVQYLMPIEARLITRERSLIKFGGGEFTVVGKVVRIFPESGNRHQPAYVDSPTVETWQQPLAAAPPKLLCKADPACAKKVRGEGVTREERQKEFEKSLSRANEALEQQTRIVRRGAVILPIAIYK
jgi:hypothetical protein